MPTQQPQPAGAPRACPAALLEGTLVADARWGVAVRDLRGVVHKTLWPFGFSARVTPNGVVLLDATASVVGREGDAVEFGGGEIDPAGTWLACADLRFTPPG